LDKRLITRIFKELQKLNKKPQKQPIKKWASELSRQFSKEVQMTKKHMKKCSTSLTTEEIQNKMTHSMSSVSPQSE
jgi:hypothetical protein